MTPYDPKATMPQTEVAFLLAVLMGLAGFVGYKAGSKEPKPIKESKVYNFLTDLDGGSGGMDPDEVDELMAVAARIIRQQQKQLKVHDRLPPKELNHEEHDRKGHNHSRAPHVHVEEYSGLVALGRRALVAGVPYSPGMLIYESDRLSFSRLCWQDENYWHCVTENSNWMRIRHENMRKNLPWFEDGASIGILRSYAKKVRKDEFIHTGPSALHGWVAWRSFGIPVGPGATEAEALIASIEEFNRADA